MSVESVWNNDDSVRSSQPFYTCDDFGERQDPARSATTRMGAIAEATTCMGQWKPGVTGHLQEQNKTEHEP